MQSYADVDQWFRENGVKLVLGHARESIFAKRSTKIGLAHMFLSFKPMREVLVDLMDEVDVILVDCAMFVQIVEQVLENNVAYISPDIRKKVGIHYRCILNIGFGVSSLSKRMKYIEIVSDHIRTHVDKTTSLYMGDFVIMCGDERVYALSPVGPIVVSFDEDVQILHDGLMGDIEKKTVPNDKGFLNKVSEELRLHGGRIRFRYKDFGDDRKEEERSVLQHYFPDKNF